jgi:Domain of unknown function (DUF1707)
VAGPGDEQAVAAAGRGYMLASHADRDQTIDVLKAAFAQGRLAKDEFDARIGQTLAARNYAQLATATAGIPAAPAPPRPQLPRPRPPRQRMSHVARWGASGVVTPAIMAAALAFFSLPGDRGYGVVTLVVAFGYFLFWLSAGTDMLWQWHSMSVPSAGMCVRCAHTGVSHRQPGSCSVRQGTSRERCSCDGYVPPGVSPRSAGPRLAPTR